MTMEILTQKKSKLGKEEYMFTVLIGDYKYAKYYTEADAIEQAEAMDTTHLKEIVMVENPEGKVIWSSFWLG